MEKSMEKLASGLRINRSVDDAAGLAVTERLRAKIRGLNAAKQNANDAISYIQTAEGGLSEISSSIIRMRELASQAASDTMSNREREFLDKEFQQLNEEILRVRETTSFNGNNVLQYYEDVEEIKIFIGASNRGANLEGDAQTLIQTKTLIFFESKPNL